MSFLSRVNLSMLHSKSNEVRILAKEVNAKANLKSKPIFVALKKANIFLHTNSGAVKLFV